MEANQVDILTPAMLGNLEQIQDSQEPGLAREFWSNVRKPDLVDRIDFNRALFHAVSLTHPHTRTQPEPDATSDFPSPNSIAQALGEGHGQASQASRTEDTLILDLRKGQGSAIIWPAASSMGRLTRQNLRGGNECEED
jgi:hypothetical protein